MLPSQQKFQQYVHTLSQCVVRIVMVAVVREELYQFSGGYCQLVYSLVKVESASNAGNLLHWWNQ